LAEEVVVAILQEEEAVGVLANLVALEAEKALRKALAVPNGA